MRKLLIFLVLLQAGCPAEAQSPTEAQLWAMQAELEALTNDLAEVRQRLDDSIAEAAALREVLYLDDRGDVVVDGANLRVQNGEALSYTTNGKGNLIVGYDEDDSETVKNGSHNLVIGGRHTYSSHSGLVVGLGNAITGPHASVSGGSGNTASGESSSINGGTGNIASGRHSTVNGGWTNVAAGVYSSVSGGHNNTATDDSSIEPGSQSSH